MIAQIEEGGTFQYDYKLVDKDGTPVLLAQLTSLAMTLYDRATNAILNSREDVSCLNTVSGATFGDTSGEGTFIFNAADNAIVGTKPFETHVALFRAVWDGGTKSWELIIQVKNLNLVP